MTQSLNLSISGLHTYSNPLSGVPKGALKVALNVNINRLNIAECRRGFTPSAYDLSTSTFRIKRFLDYQSTVLAHYDSVLGKYDPDAGWTSVGALTKPSAAQEVRSVVTSKNLYVTSDVGVKKLDGLASSLYSAGLPKGTMMELTVGATGTAVVAQKYVTYRYLIGRKDASDNLVYGGVSGRYTVQNTDATYTKDITVVAYIPDGLSTSHFVGIYRSLGLTAAGSDELYQVYEANIDSTDITNGYITFSDITPDDLTGDTIYTAPSQQGITQDNSEPPLCTDIALYQGHTFFSDIEDRHRFNFTLLSAGTPGLVNDDTITISDGATTEVYTAKASYDAGNKHFALATGGTSASRIADTVVSLVKLINIESAVWDAFLLSSGSDLPGQIRLQARALGAAQFNVVSSNENVFSPPLAAVATSSQKSSSSALPNGLAFSKRGIPEAVPLLNQLLIGNSSRILRIKASRDSLYIFKDTDGIFILKGDRPENFYVNSLDDTAILVAEKSLEAVNNQIYGLFEAGVGQVSDTGVSYISTPIKDSLLPLYAAPLAQLKQYTFGVSYETEGKYILSLPTLVADTSTNQQFIWDVHGRTWVKWNLELTAAGISSNDGKLYIGKANSSIIQIERKAYDYTDFADQISSALTITSYSGTVLTMATANITVGDLLDQGALSAYVESIDAVAGTVTIDVEQAWTTGAATVSLLSGIDFQVEWITEGAGNPAGFKQFYESNVLFQQQFTKNATIYYYSDVNPGESSIVVAAPSGNGSWGQFAWGEDIWGGDRTNYTRRFGIPSQHSRCNTLTMRITSRAAYNEVRISGASLVFNQVSTRTAR